LKKNSLILLSISICFIATSQTVRRPVAAVYTGLGAYSKNHVDVFSFTNNQASLAQMKNGAAGVYAERRFMLDELSLYQFAVAVPTQSGNFGFKAGYFGFSDYNESQVGLAYARKLGEKVDVGVQFNYYMLKVAEYGNASSINFEAGAILHVTDQLQAGIHIYNPLGSGVGKAGGESLPSIYSAGFGYDASERFFIGAEIQKEENRPVTVNAGLQYAFAEKLFARAGVASATSVFYAGAGFLLNGFRIDATASLHPHLGMTPGIMLVYNSPAKN